MTPAVDWTRSVNTRTTALSIYLKRPNASIDATSGYRVKGWQYNAFYGLWLFTDYVIEYYGCLN